MRPPPRERGERKRARGKEMGKRKRARGKEIGHPHITPKGVGQQISPYTNFTPHPVCKNCSDWPLALLNIESCK